MIHALFRCDLYSIRNEILGWSFASNRSALDHVSLNHHDAKDPKVVTNLEFKCESATAKVSKVLRAGMSILKNIIQVNDKLKVVHLIRDPRAIIHSRKGVWRKETQDTRLAADSLCKKMSEDQLVATKISVEFPGRLMTMYYEDIVTDPVQRSKQIFSFLGWAFFDKDADRINEMTIPKDKSTFSSFWGTERSDSYITGRKWRANMLHKDVYLVNKECSEQLKLFRYPELKTQKSMKDETIPLRYKNLK